MRIVYLIGPYIGDGLHETIERNIRNAERYAIDLIDFGIACITPHLNTQHFGEKALRPEQFYLSMYLEILARCDACVVIPDYENSKGSTKEIAHAINLGKPVFYLPIDRKKLSLWYRNDFSNSGFLK